MASSTRAALSRRLPLLPLQQPPGLEEDLVEKYRHIAPRFNFQRAYASVMASDLRVRLAQAASTLFMTVIPELEGTGGTIWRAGWPVVTADLRISPCYCLFLLVK